MLRILVPNLLVGNACGDALRRGTRSVPVGGKKKDHFHHFTPRSKLRVRFAPRRHRHSQAGAWERGGGRRVRNINY